MDVKPDALSYRELYRLLITCVVPRPIAWVSSMNKEGHCNLAPFSFFNVLCAAPPLMGFCPGIRQGDDRDALGAVKDTLRNVRETGEFVVNMVSIPLAEAMNITSGEYEASVNEFELAKLTTRPSKTVRPPQVAESPITFECGVYQIVDFGTQESGGSLVIGQIQSMHLDEKILKDGRVDANLVDLVGRMGGIQYTRTRDRFEMVRPAPRAAAK